MERQSMERQSEARLSQLLGHLSADACSGGREDESATRPELIPFGFEGELLRSRWAREHLRWMRRKDILGQDMFLLATYGPLRRWLALAFCQRLGREMEYVALTQDTTESDLKQRREIVAGGTATYFDQAPVRAAIEGRVLVLEGLEKVERNVMPVLNNLLENREMALEDGRFLMSAQRFDTLSQEEREAANVVRVHPSFRVVALGVPVPPFPGNPLDPPLRSRFQGRRIDRAPSQALVTSMRSSFDLNREVIPRVTFAPVLHGRDQVPSAIPMDAIYGLLRFAESLHALGQAQHTGDAGGDQAAAFHQLMYCGENDILNAGRLLQLFPGQALRFAIDRIYPPQVLYTLAKTEVLQRVVKLIADACASVTTQVAQSGGQHIFVCTSIRPSEKWMAKLQFCLMDDSVPIQDGPEGTRLFVEAVCGDSSLVLPSPGGSLEAGHFHLLSLMMQSHAAGRDLCLIGDGGSGKTFAARLFARALGYTPAETLFIYQDMTARDLLQRRSTDEFGATTWVPTPLTIAMQHGRLAILDGIHRLPVGTISSLLRLLDEREITLFDGTSFVNTVRYQEMQDRLGFTKAELASRGIFLVHPAFRVLALANPPTKQDPWLNNEVLHLFSFFSVDQDLSSQVGRSRVANLLRCIVPDVPDEFASSLSTFSMQMQQMNADPLSSVHSPVSLRQMLRMARRVVHYPHEAHSSLSNANMIKYMPKAEREACLAMMADAGIQRYDEEYSVESVSVIVTDKDGLQTDDYSRGAVLRIGDVETPCALPNNRALVPDVLFYQIPMHTRLLRSLLQDFLIGEHLLLIGNQGVGKNKLTDRLLQLMRREREYIQLHRDTTVQALTLTPTLVNGRVVWEDSPLVKALVNGRVLVIDEADKAPTEVVCVLKGLLEDGEILFADGRRFVSSRSPVISAIGEANLPPDICSIHPDFRVIALANRPGYPFLGNDFFSEMGDVFAVYSIDNPDQQSEIEMLQAYSDGAVPLGMLYKLTSAFKDLRQLTEDGVLSYPYSTRELVNVVQHLTRFPDDNITQVLENCFAFDSFDVELRQSLYSTFQRHGIPLGSNDGMGIRNSLALAHKLGPPVPTSILQQLEESVELPVARAPLVEDWKRGLGRKAGWSPAQLHTMDDKMSGRVSRFSEEVGGFSLVGNDEPCDDGIVSLADGSVAVLTQTNELQIASPEFSTIKTIAINNGAPEVFASVSSPPLVAAKSLGKLITFNTLREILVIVDPETGAAVPFACPLDAPDSGLIDAAAGGSAAAGSASNRSAFTNDRLFFGRMDVGLMDGFEIAGGCILYRDGGSVLAFVHYDTTTGLWQCTKVTLPATIRIKSVQALFSQRFLLRCSKHVWTLTLNSGLHSVSSARLTRWSEQPHATAAAHTSLEEFIFLSRPYPAVPSVRGQQHLFSAPDILAGYSTGFSEDSDDASPVTMWSFERDATQLEPPDTPPIMRRRYVGCEVSSRAGSVVCISNPQALTLEVVDMETRQLRQIHLGFQVGQPPPPPPKAEIQNQAILPKRTEKHPTVVGITETLDGTVFLLQRNGTVRLIDINTDRVREEESEWQSMIQGTADRTLERSLPFENEAVSAGAAEGADVLEIDFKRHIRWIHHQMRELNA